MILLYLTLVAVFFLWLGYTLGHGDGYGEGRMDERFAWEEARERAMDAERNW